MPSTVVHVSFALIIACALIPNNRFTIKSLLIVALPVMFLDSDAFFYIVEEGLHRALFHNIIIPSVIVAILLYDISIRDESYIGRKFNSSHAMSLIITSYTAVVIAGLGLDFADTGVNLFWPIHDQFYTLEGKFILSSENGIVQTFSEFGTEKDTTDSVVYNTPINPSSSGENSGTYPIAYKAWQLILIITSGILVSIKMVRAKYLSIE